MYVNRFAITLRHLHHLPGCKQTGLVGADSVTPRLQELSRMTVVATFKRDRPVAGYIGRRRMHIGAIGQVKGITHLVGIHLVLFIMQKDRVALHIIEREVQVVGIVSEDGSKITPQGLHEVGISLSVELFLEFDGLVGNQMQVVVQRQCLIAVAHVLIDDRAAGEHDRHR